MTLRLTVNRAVRDLTALEVARLPPDSTAARRIVTARNAAGVTWLLAAGNHPLTASSEWRVAGSESGVETFTETISGYESENETGERLQVTDFHLKSTPFADTSGSVPGHSLHIPPLNHHFARELVRPGDLELQPLLQRIRDEITLPVTEVLEPCYPLLPLRNS